MFLLDAASGFRHCNASCGNRQGIVSSLSYDGFSIFESIDEGLVILSATMDSLLILSHLSAGFVIPIKFTTVFRFSESHS